MANTFKKRVGPTSLSSVKNLKYYANGNPFVVSTSTGGNCTWYAWGRFWEVWASVENKYKNTNPWNSFTKGSPNGNACHWYDHAKSSKTLKTGLKPKPGAIICWGYNGQSFGEPGHVAFVEKVNMKSDGVTVESIEISQSGWSSGPLKNATLKPGNGKRGTNAYKLGYNSSYFNGFIYNPIDFGNPAGAIANGSSIEDDDDTISNSFNMQQRASKLYSSENFTYVKKEEKTETESQLVLNIKAALSKQLKSGTNTYATTKLPEGVLIQGVTSSNRKRLKHKKSTLRVSDLYVEAPFIELNLGGYKIGSYHGTLDNYPNYINSMNISKVNGQINQYTISMTHQIRPGDDPNLIDKLLSTVKYHPITITYGDAVTGESFSDNNAIINNVAMSRDYVSNKINYTLYAISTSYTASTYRTNFSPTTDKPSNVIRKLLWDNGEISRLLQEAFPGMKNRQDVESRGMIPTNDKVLDITEKLNISPIEYINFLVSVMSNVVKDVTGAGEKIAKDFYNVPAVKTVVDNTIKFGKTVGEHAKKLTRDSSIMNRTSYYIIYEDDKSGNYFRIKEISKDANPENSVFDINIGYPEGTSVYNFSVNNDNSWALLYENSGTVNEYIYSIDSNGNKVKDYSPNLFSSSVPMNEIQKNWWSYMLQYPIQASLTIRGLLRPINLTDYVNINVVFYGHKHITSGLYAITAQEDSLSKDGFKTTLSLTRIRDN